MKLNLGSGNMVIPGFVNVDMNPRYAQILHDLRVVPYPFKDNEIEQICAHHIVEHFYAGENIAFMDECWRILKPGGRLEIMFPTWDSPAAWIDATHVRGIHPDQYKQFTGEIDMGYTNKLWTSLHSAVQPMNGHTWFWLVILTPQKT